MKSSASAKAGVAKHLIYAFAKTGSVLLTGENCDLVVLGSVLPDRSACHQLVMCEPLRGWRHVKVTERRTRSDYAHCVRELLDIHYPKAKKVRLVQDNLNTHDGASLYEAFLPQEARRILDRIEFHYTPKHGSWLNMAETEINIMNRQCLNRRLDSQKLMAREVAAWERERNLRKACIHWTFTLAAARRKLRKLYPSIED